MKKLICILILSLGLCACSKPAEKQNDGTINACDVTCDGDDTEDSIELKEISMDEAIRYFTEKKSGVLYFGFEKCPWCQEAKPSFYDLCKSYGIDILYKKTRDDDRNLLYTDEQKEKFTPYLKDYMSNNDEGVLTLYVPLIVYIKDGVVVDGHVGTFDEHDAHERKMTEKEKEDLNKIYIEIVKQVK